VLTHSRTVQGSWTSIRHHGRDGHQWWVLTATDPDAPAPADLKATATALGAEFPAPLPGLIAATEPGNVQRWVLRDRPALKQWSKGRATLVGDAAHPTSPYAAYGAGMSIEDGYFLGVALRGVDLTDAAAVGRALQSYEDPRKPHTAKQVQMAWMLGKVFHHAPAPLRPVRDFVFDHTPFLQKVAGDSNPREINKQLALIEA
jgi:2-polyprenyl-6-methoxyphenol hydroxylase-like FAD-dependent oxidoreductase